MRFDAGARIRRREVLHGLPWMEQPVTVVSDREDSLAVFLEPGARFTFYDHPFGAHPWSIHESWAGTRVLQLHRDGDAYSVWKVFDLNDRFVYWYINFQAPIMRHVDEASYDTADHGLDIVIPGDGSGWLWKDQDDPAAMVASGRITQEEESQIRAAAAGVAAQLDAGIRWWSAWDDWVPGADAPRS